MDVSIKKSFGPSYIIFCVTYKNVNFLLHILTSSLHKDQTTEWILKIKKYIESYIYELIFMYFDLLNTTNTLSSRLVSLEAVQLVQSKIRWSNLRFSPVL